MMVSIYYDSTMVMQKEMPMPPRISDCVIIDIAGKPRKRRVAAVEWRMHDDSVVVICEEIKR